MRDEVRYIDKCQHLGKKLKVYHIPTPELHIRPLPDYFSSTRGSPAALVVRLSGMTLRHRGLVNFRLDAWFLRVRCSIEAGVYSTVRRTLQCILNPLKKPRADVR